MYTRKTITIPVDNQEVTIYISRILYIKMARNVAEIHMANGEIHRARVTLQELELSLGDYFLKVDRGCMVSALAVHSIDSNINLLNGEILDFAKRRKKELQNQLAHIQRSVISGFHTKDMPQSEEEYHQHYQCFDEMPIAFADIELVFNEDNCAVDWIFCYGNEALAKLEKMPLESLVGNSFSSVFANMDAKWLRSYERAVLFRETLEVIDFSPEIDTYLNVICFPTFKGHCGCILFDISKMEFVQEESHTQNALRLYFERMMSIRPSNNSLHHE